jgi:hypothetical protein
VKADDDLEPLSYTRVTDNKEYIDFTGKQSIQRKEFLYLQNFKNRFFSTTNEAKALKNQTK